MATTSFLLDAQELEALASTPVVERGTRYFQEGRVFDLAWDDEDAQLQASVEGAATEPYLVVIRQVEGELAFDCSCPFDWEPVCKHSVATLLAYAALQPVTDGEAAGAARQALEERIRKGRTEVGVTPASGRAGLGEWVARSVHPTGGIRKAYRVLIRSLDEPLNACECRDFELNQLGTCKHIEAVLHRLRKGGEKPSAPPTTVASLAWDVPDAPRVRVRRGQDLGPAEHELLDRHVDEAGLLRGTLPDAVAHLEQELQDRVALDIGDDVLGLCRRLGEESLHREHARRVGDAIRVTGGVVPGLRARLYPYQVEGVAFLAGNGRALLADDMGLGKTLQAIAAAVWLRQHQGVERVLVVCPASLKRQWAREIERFAGLDVEVVEGPAAARRVQYRRKAPFTIMNYELVVRDHDRLNADLCPDLLVLDEAQRVKNWRTKTATAVKELQTRYAFVLSGTPLENRLADLYSVMQVVDQRLLGPLWRFELDFHVTDDRGKVLGYRNLSELRHRLAPAMLRRDRRIVADQLPERIDHRLDLPLTRKQQEIHDPALLAAQRLAQLSRRRRLTPKEESQLLASLQTARMACDAAGLVDEQTQGSPKLTELGSLLDELCVGSGAKVVVFSEWERMTRMAAQVAEELGLGVIRLHGRVPSGKRGELIQRFHDDPAAQVFISTDAGGVGLNLQVAQALINLDLPWNPAVLEQRIARIHRLGQTVPVQIIQMVSSASYEQRVEQLLLGKRDLFDTVVAGTSDHEVLGLSRRAIDQVLDGLAEGDDERPPSGPHPPHETPDPAAETRSDTPHEPPVPEDSPATATVQALQSSLNGRLVRVMVTRTGLIAIVDPAAPEDHALAHQLSGALPVAVVDAPTWAGLSRLGSLADGAQVAYDRAETASREPPLVLAARQKLDAAGALLTAECHTEAIRLAAEAMLLRLAARAEGPPAPPRLDDAALWLYGTAVPAGLVSTDDATRLLRAEALSRHPAVPPALCADILQDARQVVLSAG